MKNHWSIFIPKSIEKKIKKLGPEYEKKTHAYITNILATHENPRSLGAKLKTTPSWRFRADKVRVTAFINDKSHTIVINDVSYRGNIYRRMDKKKKLTTTHER